MMFVLHDLPFSSLLLIVFFSKLIRRSDVTGKRKALYGGPKLNLTEEVEKDSPNGSQNLEGSL